MKTGHSRVAGTVGAFPNVSGGAMWDLCSTCELNEQESVGSDLTEAAM